MGAGHLYGWPVFVYSIVCFACCKQVKVKVMSKKSAKRVWLTVGDMITAFGVTRTTIGNWRKDKGMPAYVQKVDKAVIVRFDANEVILWARKHGYDAWLNIRELDEAVKARTTQPVGPTDE